MYAKIKLNLRLELRFHNDFTKKIVQFAERTNLGRFNVISNCRRVIMFQKGLEMFRFPVVKSPLRFSNVKIVAVPATSFVNDFG